MIKYHFIDGYTENVRTFMPKKPTRNVLLMAPRVSSGWEVQERGTYREEII